MKNAPKFLMERESKISITKPGPADEPDFCRGDAKTLARIAELTESHDRLTKLLEILQEAAEWARLEGIYLSGDLPFMIKTVQFSILVTNDALAEVAG